MKIQKILLILTCCFSAAVAGEGQKPGAVIAKNKIIKKIPIKVSQGVAVGLDYFYAISNKKVVKYKKKNAEMVATWVADTTLKKFDHFKHLNSGTVVGGHLYCAHSRFPVDPNNCSVEIWNIKGNSLKHSKTIRLPRKYGSLTWIDNHQGRWWMCYAVYGKNKNRNTRLVEYNLQDGKFTEVRNWTFPQSVVKEWGKMSCSGGSWRGKHLYVTGHDHAKAFVLNFNEDGELKHVRTEAGVGFSGQAIAWDRSVLRPTVLWGIVKNKDINLTLIPDK